MKVFITYDRYENNEWFYVYHIGTDFDSAIEHCKQQDLFDFISYGPDDCHSFQLQSLEMTKVAYKKLCDLIKLTEMTKKDEGYDAKIVEKANEKLEKMLTNIYEHGAYNCETIISTDGYSDFIHMASRYARSSDFKYESDDEDENEGGLYEITCCCCEEDFLVDQGIYDDRILNCPLCDEEIEINVDDDDCDDEIECSDEKLDAAMEELLTNDKLFKRKLREYIDAIY